MSIGNRFGPSSELIIFLSPNAWRRAVSRSRTIRLGTLPVVPLDLRVLKTSLGAILDNSSFLNRVTGRYGRSLRVVAGDVVLKRA
jgi:hypothetical protein